MKRLLLSACIVGLVFAGHTNSPQGRFVSEPLNVALAAPAVSGGVSSKAKSPYPGLQQVALRSPAVGALQVDGTPVGSIDELFAPALPQAAKPKEEAKAGDASLVDENAMWVVVIRGAWMHSGPSVSTPVVGHQSPGKEMHLIDSSQGWYQVLDPETGDRGWVYAKYYLEPIDRPGQKRVVVMQEPQPTPVNASPAVSAAPPKAVRKVLQQPRFLAPPQAQAERVRPRARPLEGVAGLLDRAFRR